MDIRRSELTCPAHSPKMMAKAAASAADEVIFDLEDACAVSQKIGARRTLVEALTQLDFQGKIRAFRTNGLRTRYFYRDLIDVVEQAGSFVDCVVIPKVETAEEVRFVDRLLSQIEENSNLPPGKIQIEVLVESAKGILHAEHIAAASKRMASLIFGIADYAGDVGARQFASNPFQVFHYQKSHLIAAAKAAGILAIDHVTVQFRDVGRVGSEAAEAAAMGFDGKWAIHPSHIEGIHQAFTPTRDELARAIAMTEAYTRADLQQGEGAIVFEDQMVDAASLAVERKKIEIGKKSGLIDANGRLK